ncbi:MULTISPECIES: hypothetical protein [unclassified Rhizobium]|uniref:hypothetical protein n=1 Tax=unclassified Rhizobium TaxID=2613769 RepID=UPI0011AB34B0|nr:MULTISPECIES: hypothetical protein [unclassified Rhizobium]
MAQVDEELGELGRCNKMQPPNRQRLLQVIHATRALDSCLNAVLTHHALTPKHGIGKMLHQLPSLHPSLRGHLPYSTVVAYVSAIAMPRNRYAHRAGSFPNSTHEVDKIISEVHACLASIL